jgi:hypothetical protein
MTAPMVSPAVETLPDVPIRHSGTPRQALSSLAQVALLAGAMAAALFGVARWQTGSVELVWPWLQGQRLLVEPRQVRLGEVPPRTILERQIRVVNVSSQPMTLLGSQQSCGCITLDEFPIRIAPGQEHRVALKIGTSDKTGPFEHSIKLFTDEAGSTARQVIVAGTVR